MELFRERKSHYEELAEKDDETFKDTVEMAEETGTDSGSRPDRSRDRRGPSLPVHPHYGEGRAQP